MAMFGRQAAFGLKSFNLPAEVIDAIHTEEELMEVLGDTVQEDISAPVPDIIIVDAETIQMVDIDLVNIPVVVEQTETSEDIDNNK